MIRRTARALGVVGAGMLALGAIAGAQIRREPSAELADRIVAGDRLKFAAETAPLGSVADEIADGLGDDWAAFLDEAGADWIAELDRRSGRLAYAEGAGLPWVPGYGNRLSIGEIEGPVGADGVADLVTLEALARAFIARHERLFGVSGRDLALAPGRSGQWEAHLATVEFDRLVSGRIVEGSSLFFVVNNGNLIQFGTRGWIGDDASAPRPRLTAEEATAVVRAHLGEALSAEPSVVQPATLRLLPARSAEESADQRAPLELRLVWESALRWRGILGTFRARVDAETGELIELVDVNEYPVAQVTGGVRGGDGLPPDTILPMPFANVSSGGFTNSAGQYNWTSGTVTSTLNGQYVRALDNCGAISASSDATGNILFGTSAGTDCTTPGSGGAGNTHASRTQFYHLNRAKEAARGWLPANAWLNAQLTANVNINDTCNAYWNGASVNFFRSGGGCANTGELPGVSLHEYGHGFDSNDGNGSSPENGTGETYGDFTAALSTHDSCVGDGFLGGNCGGYGNPCNSCTGVRDIDWGARQDNVPSDVNNFTRLQCPTPNPLNPNYVGPCGLDAINDGQPVNQRREGHCESYVSSEALWDFAERDLPSPGSGAAWLTVDRLWYLSRPTATAAFRCERSVVPWTSDGCVAGSLFRTMRAADDDDGNLANGTPHSCDLFDAMNRHGIACASDPGANVCFSGCAAPAAPVLSATAGDNQVGLSWTSPGGGIVFDVYRSDVGCDAGFTRIASGVGATALTDLAVANGGTYYYQVTAYPSGNGACVSAPSNCINATPSPCATIPPPTGLAASATAPNQITLLWNDSAAAGVASYDVVRSLVSGGPYALIGNVPDTGGPYVFQDTAVSGGTTYYYSVRSVEPGGCRSQDPPEASATATGECTLSPLFGGLTSVTALGGGQGCGLRLAWNAATPRCGGALTYAVYRSTTSGFTPGPANQIAACVGGATWDDTTMPLDTSVYYVVRAEDGGAVGGGPCNGGNMETNTGQLSGFASSTGGSGTLYSNDFESATGAPFYDWADVSFGGLDATWRGRQNCAGNIFRFGGVACADDYGINTFRARKPGNAAGISVPVGSANVQLSFQHRWQFENSGATLYDGATLALSLDGTNYTVVPAGALTGGPAYSGVVASGSGTCPPAGAAGIPIWGAQSSGYATNTMQTTTVNLDAACNAITGGSGGCAGQTIHVAWTAITDCTVVRDGWFIDNVAITRTPIAACTAAPQAVQFLTATGKEQQATLEWLNSPAGPFASTRLRTSTAAVPADPTAGTLLVDEPGSTGQKELFVHNAGGGSNGVVQQYAAFANSGAAYSGRRAVSGLPQSTAGNWKWNFSTPASALAPPIQGRGIALYAPSNDRALYGLGLGVGASGGLWRAGFQPAAMNAPAQSSPTVMLDADTALPHDAAFVGSQDGYVYCFHAGTGLGCAGWPAGGRSAASFGMVQAQPMFDPATQRILFGTRNAAGANGFHALNVADGTTAWSFTNTVPQGGDGQAMGIVSGPALILGSRVIFTSRVRTGGSAHTVWALDFTAGSVALAWTRDLGDVDAAPTHDFTLNRVLVGTNGSTVHALDPNAAGATLWSRNFGDGPVKTFIYYHAAISRLYFATATTVWSVPSSGATGSDWSLGGLFSPTRPLLQFTTTRAYVGACASAACTSGRLIELDAANSWSVPKTLDLAGVGGLGPVTIDRSQTPAVAHAGSRTGRVVAVQVPLP